MTRVSEVVTVEEVKQWQLGDVITIQAGTGKGKSYFIKNILYAHALYHNKKILMLIHRVNCINQFQMEINEANKQDTIHLCTYQHLEALYKQNKTFDFSPYYYIVCDEFHYFMSDAAFNKTTDISLNMILEQMNAIRIFMSATGDRMNKYITGYKKLSATDYNIPIDYDFIEKFIVYNKKSTLDEFISNAIKRNEKVIFFIQSAKEAYELYSKYKDYCMFNCSKSNGKYYKYVDQKKVNKMLKNEKFDDLILITTVCMDAGVNIIDTELKHIVCDIFDIGVLIQCIGRKRIQNEHDKINLYVKSVSNQQLGGKETYFKKKKEKALFLREHTVKEYIEKYPRDKDYYDIVYDDIVEDPDKGTKKINYLMYFKCLFDLADIEEMKKYKYHGYSNHLSKLFNKEITWLDEETQKMQLEEYLESLVGQKLYKENQKELIDKIDLRVDGKQQKSYRKLNEGLEMINVPYIILPKKSNDSRYWIIDKIVR